MQKPPLRAILVRPATALGGGEGAVGVEGAVVGVVACCEVFLGIGEDEGGMDVVYEVEEGGGEGGGVVGCS